MSSDQFTDPATNMFFQRIRFDFSELIVGPGNTDVLERAVKELGTRYNMAWSMAYVHRRKRVAILVSSLDHCHY